MLATFPNQVLLVAIDPVDIGHSTVTTYAMVAADINDAADSAAKAASAKADGASLLAAGALEDNEMSEAVQRGLRSGANSFVEFGRHESAIGHFHATLDERLEWSR